MYLPIQNRKGTTTKTDFAATRILLFFYIPSNTQLLGFDEPLNVKVERREYEAGSGPQY